VRAWRATRAWAAAAAVMVVAAAHPAVAAAGPLPSFEEVRAAHRPSDLVVVDRRGEPIQTIRIDHRHRTLAWVPIEDLSPALLQAIVVGEDQRFWSHAGIDFAALARSAWANAWNTRTRGASTLTMQLAGLLDADLERPVGGRSLPQKVDQAFTALQLERRWTKAQILEAYLNRVPLRGELIGIEALAQTLFGKHPHGLDAIESAIAAALVRGPNAAADVVARRACGLLERQGLACTTVEAVTVNALARRGGAAMQAQIAPHAARAAMQPAALSPHLLPPGGDRLAAARASGRLATTLDARMQRLARQALETQWAELAGHQVQDGAVLVIDNLSGEVRVWVGSAGRGASAPAVDAVLARRQPGSTLKPFVYQLALEQRRITAGSALDDSPAQLPTGAGAWRPQNYDHRYQGWVSARVALASSLNLPAVRVAQLAGLDALHGRLQALGFELDQGPGHYGWSLALGSADVSLLALTQAYRSLALQGRLAPLRLHPGIEPPVLRRVADAGASFVVADILADPLARASGFGLDSALAGRQRAAVKTGTSKDLRDNWCIGFNGRYTVGVWMGNADGQPMHRVSGVTGAAPVWQAVMAGLLALDGSDLRAAALPPAPATVQRRPIEALRVAVAEPPSRSATHGQPVEPARDEWFLAGSDPPERRAPGVAAIPVALPGEQRIGITYPPDGSILALDPDIPMDRQRLWFEGERGTWVLDGRRLFVGSRWSWTPVPGRHRLALLDAEGRERAAIRFEVRAAPPLGRR
jgi:penicillin-binding protein 1C